MTFSWPESSDFGTNETVVIGIRLLGEVDLDSEYKQIARVGVTPTSNAALRWDMYRDSPQYVDRDGNNPIQDAEMPTDTLYRPVSLAKTRRMATLIGSPTRRSTRKRATPSPATSRASRASRPTRSPRPSATFPPTTTPTPSTPTPCSTPLITASYTVRRARCSTLHAPPPKTSRRRRFATATATGKTSPTFGWSPVPSRLVASGGRGRHGKPHHDSQPV